MQWVSTSNGYVISVYIVHPFEGVALLICFTCSKKVVAHHTSYINVTVSGLPLWVPFLPMTTEQCLHWVLGNALALFACLPFPKMMRSSREEATKFYFLWREQSNGDLRCLYDIYKYARKSISDSKQPLLQSRRSLENHLDFHASCIQLSLLEIPQLSAALPASAPKLLFSLLEKAHHTSDYKCSGRLQGMGGTPQAQGTSEGHVGR